MTLTRYWVWRHDLIDHEPCSTPDTNYPQVYQAEDVRAMLQELLSEPSKEHMDTLIHALVQEVVG